MNQQRSRRYVAAVEKVEDKPHDEKMRFFNKNGRMYLNNALQGRDCQDSNIITPGTPFMSYLAECIKDFAAHRASYDPFYQHLDIIFSDASVPGEGEHKIIDWIRRSRTQPSWEPNQTHVLYGLDADLIFLGLATHEPNFLILRENVLDRRPICKVCGDYGHTDCNAFPLQKSPIAFGVAFQFCNLKKLRAYLNTQLVPLSKTLGAGYDFERALDDWIALAFLCGNDFLPHLPSVAVKSGAIDKLTDLYIKVRPTLTTWLTNGEDFNINYAKKIFESLAATETEDLKAAHPPQRGNRRNDLNAHLKPTQQQLESHLKNATGAQAAKLMMETFLKAENEEAKEKLAALEAQAREEKESSEAIKLTDDFTTADLEIKSSFSDLGEQIQITKPGYKERYYKTLFDENTNPQTVAQEYLKGLRWVFKYYFQGYENIDWSWYYPYHFAPLVSDFAPNTNVAMNLNFADESTPFRPFEQLLTVLPPVSGITVLPQCYAKIMLRKENADWYPRNFRRELNGSNVAWKAVPILSFVDQDRLLSQAAEAQEKLTEDELKRNSLGSISILYNSSRSAPMTIGECVPVEYKKFIPSFLDYFSTAEAKITEAHYTYPKIHPDFGLRSRLLQGCDAQYTLTERDINNFERENTRIRNGQPPGQYRGPRTNYGPGDDRKQRRDQYPNGPRAPYPQRNSGSYNQNRPNQGNGPNPQYRNSNGPSNQRGYMPNHQQGPNNSQGGPNPIRPNRV